MSDRHVTLYVPGLLSLIPLFAELPADDVPDTRLLERLLARAERAEAQLGEAQPERGARHSRKRRRRRRWRGCRPP